MKSLIAISSFFALSFCSPVASQTTYNGYGNGGSPQSLYLAEEPTMEGSVLQIRIVNWADFITDSEHYVVVDTEIGPITLFVQTTPNKDCTPECPDTYTVYDLPGGYVAIPSSLTIAEYTADLIHIYEFGGV